MHIKHNVTLRKWFDSLLWAWLTRDSLIFLSRMNVIYRDKRE